MYSPRLTVRFYRARRLANTRKLILDVCYCRCSPVRSKAAATAADSIRTRQSHLTSCLLLWPSAALAPCYCTTPSLLHKQHSSVASPQGAPVVDARICFAVPCDSGHFRTITLRLRRAAYDGAGGYVFGQDDSLSQDGGQEREGHS